MTSRPAMHGFALISPVILTLVMAGVVCRSEAQDQSFALDKATATLIGEHCTECHDGDTAKGKLNLAAILKEDVTRHSGEWEKVIRRLGTRQMPPAKESRPSEAEYERLLTTLTGKLDTWVVQHPAPGRTETLRRLNRTEYQNAIRDLLALDIDAATLLPPDEASHGFDNVTVGTLSPTLLDRYITAAQKISRLVVGSTQRAPGGDAFRIRPDITQEERVEGLPFGTRGGGVFAYTFPQEGEYEVQIRLARDRNEDVEGLKEAHEVIVLLDRAQVQTFTVKPPPAGKGFEQVDAHLKFRVPVKAGPHQLGVTFLKNPSSLLETERQPYNAHFNFHRHPRIGPAIYQVTVTGPFTGKSAQDTPSRQRLFVTYPSGPTDEEVAARKILASLMRRAYRRPVSDDDVKRVLPFFEEGRKEGGFDGGIEAALSAVLVSREFLFRVETPPSSVAKGSVYQISDLELASRLSFFLWSSIPDDELLTLAARGELSRPPVLAAQTRRMLADGRSQSLVRNFAGQWLHLRNLDSITPDGRLFPDFDDNLRQAFRRETEMLFEEVLRQDRSVLDLVKAEHTYLNERLAKHYEIPHVYGTHFRRVALTPESQRGGLLRHGSVLTVTSYATRTSPVMRGKWVLENLLGTPPPPPAPDVPALDDNNVSARLPVRERLAAHRANAACASCHDFIDPPGFALENFDAIGQWRALEEDRPVDASGGLPDGSQFTGVAGLEEGLLKRPEIFAGTMTEKLLTFALGRGVEAGDGPAIRSVLASARPDQYRFSSIILGIVNSTPFRMRQNL